MTPIARLAASVLFFCGASGCGDDTSGAFDSGANDSGTDAAGTDAGGGDAASTDGGETEMLYMPPISELEVGEWHELRPGGETTCARGTPYAFYVYVGASPNLAVDFIGGGACWNSGTCSVAGALFSENVDNIRLAFETGVTVGISDMDNPENPIAGFTHVILPYCTGDIHWGNAVAEYGEGDSAFTIQHKGAVNTRAVLDWVYANVTAPEKVLTTGCSAGGYGSILWSAYLANQYPGAIHSQLSDSAAGIITDDFFMQSFPSWNATEAAPDFVSAVDFNTATDLHQVYNGFASAFPSARFAQYNTLLDDNQTFFFTAMGGEGGAEGWSGGMLASLGEITEPNFRSFIAPGEKHCIILDPDFYTVESGGVSLATWTRDLVNGDPVENVSCEGCGP